MSARATHVVLVNLGTPDRADPAAVREFLQEFLSDPDVVDYPAWFWQPILRRMVLRSRPRRVAELYGSIWYERACGPVCPDGGCSPLVCGTRRLAAALGAALGDHASVDWAFRYGRSSIARALERARAAERVVVVPLFPQRTSSSSGSIVRETRRAALDLGIAERVELAGIAPDESGYVGALADRCRTTLAAAEASAEHLLISFHGIPTRYDRRERGVYAADCRRTTEALLQALDWDPARATLCYQSKFGPEPWLKPNTAELLAKLARDGTDSIAVVTPGFLTEGLETLEEIAVQGRETFRKAGGRGYAYLPAVEDHPAFVGGLAELVRGADTDPRSFDPRTIVRSPADGERASVAAS